MIGIASLSIGAAMADEGMWLPSRISERISDMQSKGFELTAEDIYSVEKSSLKDGIVLFGGGCTGELISPNGLLITNHHCGYRQIQAHSSVEHDYLTDGFWAMSLEEELPNENLSVKFLIRMEDVTDKVLKGWKKGMSEEKRLALIEKNSGRLTKKASKEGPGYIAEVKPVYYGNQYYLFVYQEFTDVRLVGAPASSIGKFGGDTDNWMWPRHTGDFSLFRIYADRNNNPAPYSEDNVPYVPERFFKISVSGIKEGDFTMIYGFPGSTREYLLSDEIRHIAEVSDPHKVALRTLRLDIQKEEMAKSAETRIRYASKNAGIANAWKKWQGEMLGIEKNRTIERRKEYEEGFMEWAENKAEYTGIIPQMKELIAEIEEYRLASDYYREAIMAVEAVSFAQKLMKSDYSDETSARFFKDYHMPIDRMTFIGLTSAYLQNIPEKNRPSGLAEMLGEYGNSIEDMADAMFSESCLADREKYTGNSLAQKKNDIFTRYSEMFRKHYEDSIAPFIEKTERKLELLQRTYMKAQMEYDSTRVFYPDANLTLRISYGQVKGYSPADAVQYLPVSTLEGIMQKDNPEIYDYDIPQKLRDLYISKDYGKWEENGTVPVCFLATNHTTGGNSGSPVLDSEGNLIGVNFDRVWEGTMSDIEFDPDRCRNIALDIRYVLFIIDKVAEADHLIEEMVLED